MSSFTSSFPFPYTNPCGENGSLVVVRHGERVDKTKLSDQWHTECQRDHSHCQETFYSRVNDPPLTEVGKLQAIEVANTLKQDLLKSLEKPQVIFSSKLIRSLMTAFEIAKELSLPICVSRGFSLTSAAVVEKDNRFLFLSIEEMRELCPGVVVIDGDRDIFESPQQQQRNEVPASVSKTTSSSSDSDNDNNNVESSNPKQRPRSLSDEKMQNLPDKTWEHSLRFLGNWKYSIVVAHRESIRMLSDQRLDTPYCCYGVFSFQSSPPSSSGVNRDVEEGVVTHQLERLAQRDGTPIRFVRKDNVSEYEELIRKRTKVEEQRAKARLYAEEHFSGIKKSKK